jgi:hypothetical protein
MAVTTPLQWPEERNLFGRKEFILKKGTDSKERN